MNRLTERDEFGNADIIEVDSADLQLNLEYKQLNLVTSALNRLAEYEDTGLEPSEIEAIKAENAHLTAALDHYKQLESEGRLVELPCKVGDTVWTNFAMSGWYLRNKDKPYSAKVVFVGLNDSDAMGGGFINVVYNRGAYMAQFNFSDIGKTVFFTRAEAEKC